jgi:hypothetical protein
MCYVKGDICVEGVVLGRIVSKEEREVMCMCKRSIKKMVVIVVCERVV